MDQERRRGARLPAYLPVELHRRGTRWHVIQTLTKDVSAGGIRCLSPVPLPATEELDVELSLAKGDTPIATKAKAVWSRALQQSEQFDLGLAFQEMSPETLRRLSSYLDVRSTHPAHIPA